jgi:hypothetical protein
VNPDKNDWSVVGRYEGNAPQSSGLLSAFVAVENVFNRSYDVTVAGTAAAPLISLGIPRTVRVGFDVTHF